MSGYQVKTVALSLLKFSYSLSNIQIDKPHLRNAQKVGGRLEEKNPDFP